MTGAPTARSHNAGTVAIALGSTAVGAAPFFLVGTLAVRIRHDLGFDEAALGGILTARFVTSALCAAVAGRAVQRFGATRSLRVGGLLTALALIGIALSPTLLALTAAIAFSGLGGAILGPAGDLWLATRLPSARHGLAFGIKQAGQPVAALLAGLAVPGFGATVGWRWAFVAAAAAALALAVAPRNRNDWTPRPVQRQGDVSVLPMVVLAAAMGAGTAAIGGMSAFLVSWAIEVGVAEGIAGLVFAFGSVLGIGSRLFFGHRADTRPGGLLPTVAAMLALGAGGYLLVASGSPVALFAAIPLIFCCGWGWTGLFSLAIVRANPNAPAAAIGMTQTGAFIGGMIGPALFGAVAARSYEAAWVVTALLSSASAVGIIVGRRFVRRDLGVGHTPVTPALLSEPV